MAEISARFSAGVTVDEWTDPVSGAKPSRINPFPEHPHLRYRGSVGVQVEIKGKTAGGENALDASLGGQLFYLDFVEWPHSNPLEATSSPAGQSSIQRFTPSAAGHYTLRLWREDHGAVILHLDVS